MALLASHALCRDLVVSGRPEPCVLLELDEAVLGEVLRDGVSIKGSLDGDAVLCTSEATFDLKTVETTNSLLLVPEGEPSTSRAVAVSAARSHIELIRAAPRWEGLDAALAATSYGDDDHEAANENFGNLENNGARKSSGVFSAAAPNNRRNKSNLLLSFPQLLQRVQASESELRAELAARGAFSWRREEGKSGKESDEKEDSERQAKRSKKSDPSSSLSTSSSLPAVRVLDPPFEASVLDFLLLTAASRGWKPHALPTEDLISSMTSSRVFDEVTGELGGGYDRGLLQHALWRWSSRRTEGGRNGMRASDDGGNGKGNGGGGVSPSPGGETPGAAASQRESSSSAPVLFDEDLHEASAEAFAGKTSGGGGTAAGSGTAAAAGTAPKRPPLPALLSLDEATILRHEARKLLSASPTWPERAFSAAWKEALERLGVEVARPAVSLDLAAATSSGGGALSGLATLLPPQHQNQTERTVLRLDASALPRDPRSRFAALFAAKARWRKEEIAPYLLGAAVAPGTPGGMGALLLAHARASQSEPDAPVFFSAR